MLLPQEGGTISVYSPVSDRIQIKLESNGLRAEAAAAARAVVRLRYF
jgi:hypothetical protein